MEKKNINTEPQKENLPRNLFTNYEDTLMAMAKIEALSYFGDSKVEYNEAWLKKQANDTNKYTASFGVKVLKGLNPDSTYTFVIYGDSGFNRWIIDAKGNVMFSGIHSLSKKVTEKVLELGFEVV